MGEKFNASYAIHPERDLIYMKFVGDIDAETLFSFVKTMRSDPAFKQGMMELADCTECTFQGKFRDVVSYANARAIEVPVLQRSRCATLVASEEIINRGRIFAVLHAPLGIEVELFTDKRAALEWLGVGGFEIEGKTIH